MRVRSHFQQVLLLLATLCLTAASVGISVTPPASRYEYSIYNSFSPTIWVALTGAALISVLTIYLSAISEDDSWLPALTILIMSYGLLFSLPALHGWVLVGRGSGDVLTHVAMANEMWTRGQFGSRNWYPAMHVLLGYLNRLGLEWISATSLLATVYTALWIIGIAIWTRSLTHSHYRFILALALAAPLLLGSFHRSTQPAIYSFMLLPLTMFTIRRVSQDRRRFQIIAIFLISLLIVFHPITAGFLLVMIVVGIVSGTISVSQTGSLGLIASVGILWWYLAFNRSTEAILIFIYGTEGAAAKTTAAAASLSGISLITRFIEYYGAIFLYFGAAGLCVTYLVYRILQGYRPPPVKRESVGHYIMGFVIASSFLIIGAILTNPIRVSIYFLLGSIIMLAVYIPQSNGNYTQRLVSASIILLLVLTIPLTIGMVYTDYTHLTHQETEGTKWHVEYSNLERPTMSFQTDAKMDWFIHGSYSSAPRPVHRSNTEAGQLPDRLGYSEHSQIAETTEEPAYAITKKQDRVYYETVTESHQLDQTYYTEDDISQLNSDPTAQRIYSSEGYEVWVIKN